MGNPNPIQTKEFKAKQYKAKGEIPSDLPLSKKMTGVRLPLDIEDAIIRALPQEERVPWLRKVICDAVRAELLKPEQN